MRFRTSQTADGFGYELNVGEPFDSGRCAGGTWTFGTLAQLPRLVKWDDGIDNHLLIRLCFISAESSSHFQCHYKLKPYTTLEVR